MDEEQGHGDRAELPERLVERAARAQRLVQLDVAGDSLADVRDARVAVARGTAGADVSVP